MGPSTTAIFRPLSLPFLSVARMFLGSTAPGPSARAKVPISSPLASFGRYFFFCASLPATSSASANR